MPFLALSVALSIQTMSSRFQFSAPLPSVPGVQIDSETSLYGIANELCRAKGLQARILWVDETANLERLNSVEKIEALAAKIADSGFNTVVLDVKSISGHTLYPSKIAPQIAEWKGQRMVAGFDPLKHFSVEAKKHGLSFLVSMNAFSEGHQLFKVGPGYDHPDWQTVVYQPQLVMEAENHQVYNLQPALNKMPSGEENLALFDAKGVLPTASPDLFAVTLSSRGRVIDGFEGGGIGPNVPTIPGGGFALFGRGKAAEFLRANAEPGASMIRQTVANFNPIGMSDEKQYPLITNPNNPDVQNRIISIIREIIGNYDVDGVLFDDRYRYAGINADFSPITRDLFEKHVGKKLAWPKDVFEFRYTDDFKIGMKPGAYYDEWMAWRASVLRNFASRIRKIVKEGNPKRLFGLYAGSWYGEYPAFGNNYASPDSQAGFWFLTRKYRETGLAPELDLFISGCYYPTATIYQSLENAKPLGACVESAASLCNRLVRDQALTYSGIMLSQFKGNPGGLTDALQAALAASQGVMVFDLSHEIDPFWSVFKQAFAIPARPPHAQESFLQTVRARRKALDKRGEIEPPVIIPAGSAGTGF